MSYPQSLQKNKRMYIFDYNKSKAYIDLSDRLKVYSHCFRNNNKWCIKLSIGLILDSTLMNAFLLFKDITKIFTIKFRQLLFQELSNINNLLEAKETYIENQLEEYKKIRCTILKTNKYLERSSSKQNNKKELVQSNLQKKNCNPRIFRVHKSTKTKKIFELYHFYLQYWALL